MKTAAGAGRLGARRHLSVFVPLLAALIVLSWLALWAWARSPYGRYLEHGNWLDSGPAAALCRSVPGGGATLAVLLYAAAWILMTAAMMLPSVLPLYSVFDRLTMQRPDHGRLLGLLVLGYMTAWGGAGVLAHALHQGVLMLSAQLAWQGWLIGAATLALAGAFQFSRLKQHCLEQCRSPLGFVIRHWRGQAPQWQAYRLGIRHGLFCLGCCWALMLLMFGLGAGSLGWMLLLAAVMATEKNLPGGQRLSAPLGFALLAWAGVVVATHA